MFDIISIGDATIDTIIKMHDASLLCKKNAENCLLCFHYGDKIPVQHMTRLVAGNAANNAVACSRLGMNAAYCGILGYDENGDWIIKKLRDEGVATVYVTQPKGAISNASTVINFKGERTIFVYHAPRTYKLPAMDGTHWVYYTSVGKNHSSYNRAIVAFVKKTGYKLGFNPGTYQLRAGVVSMKPILKVCAALFVNVQEAELLVGKTNNIKSLLDALFRLGPKLVVITDGMHGSYAFNGDMFFKMGIVKGTTVERTGAGDAYASTFIAALHFGKSIPEAMCLSATNSMSVVGKIGPQAGLLTMQELLALHKKTAHVCAYPW